MDHRNPHGPVAAVPPVIFPGSFQVDDVAGIFLVDVVPHDQPQSALVKLQKDWASRAVSTYMKSVASRINRQAALFLGDLDPDAPLAITQGQFSQTCLLYCRPMGRTCSGTSHR